MENNRLSPLSPNKFISSQSDKRCQSYGQNCELRAESTQKNQFWSFLGQHRHIYMPQKRIFILILIKLVSG